MAAGSGSQPAEAGAARLNQAVSYFQGHGCHNLINLQQLFFL